jgi:hypothetical protein
VSSFVTAAPICPAIDGCVAIGGDRDRLHAGVEDLDDAYASEVLEFALHTLVPTTDGLDGLPHRQESGVEVDRQTLWEVARPITAEDRLWTIVGLLENDGPTDMLSNKRPFLSEIYANLKDKGAMT